MQRRLAAILSADVVGYSRLMEHDEAGTLARLKANRQAIFEPQVHAYNSRLFKLLGDGALVEFSSVVAAIECARKIQTATQAAAPDEPEDQRIRYRIGVNLGEVIVEGEDIYGEGVNVAARLQALAPIGGVAISRLVKDQVAGKVSCEFEDLGEVSVKNIERPVHVFALRPLVGKTASLAREAREERISICVLPFANMSGDPEQEYFSDGVTEDIITDLSKVSSLSIVSRNTAFTFKGKPVTVKDVARQLGVTHVLEGSVRKSGKRVRVTAQLIEGASDSHIWAERYDRDLEDIFALQDEISKAIVAALKVRLLPSEMKAIEHRSTTNAEAYKFYLMARQYNIMANSRHREIIIRLCKRALDLDPDYARAWALLAICQSNLRLLTGATGDSGWHAAERALALDPGLAEAHAAKGRILTELGRLDEALAEHQVALRLDPESYEINCAAARCFIAMRRYDDAIRCLERAAELAPTEFWAVGMVTQCYEAQKNLDKARDAARRTLSRVEKVISTEPDHGVALGFGFTALTLLGEAERAEEWSERALILDPDNINLRYNLACGFVKIGDLDRALELLKQVFDASQLEGFNWFRVDTDLDPLRSDPRFEAMMEEVERRLGPRTGSKTGGDRP